MLEQFLQKLKASPEAVNFEDTMAVIESVYHYTTVSFSNGNLTNQAGENEGSCKLFSFAQINHLNKEQTLALFGKYYRDDVLNDPKGNDHQNIRNFMQTGWDGIRFEQQALKPK